MIENLTLDHNRSPTPDPNPGPDSRSTPTLIRDSTPDPHFDLELNHVQFRTLLIIF